ncbi:MAG: hypothetical protein ACE5ER_10815 [Nitrospinaceae bacterium]
MKKIYLTWLFTLVVWVTAVPAVLGQVIDQDQVAVSPYAQVVPGGPTAGGFYSFVAITHPSLSRTDPTIDVTVSYEGPAASLLTGGVRSVGPFTINAGETHKVFIVGTNHPTVNPTTNPALVNSRTHFITTVGNAATSGNVRVLASNTNPGTPVAGTGNYDNLNQLSMWGVIFHESNSAGFAMEFIGDMHDSTVLGIDSSGNVNAITGRGIN